MSNRSKRVAGEIHKVLSELLIRGIRDPRFKPVSITSVDCTADLRLARVRFVPLGGIGDAEEILAGLRSASGYLGRETAKRIKVKYAPKLEFFIDEKYHDNIRLIQRLDKMSDENKH
jgi:ribosome-binding factor A